MRNNGGITRSRAQNPMRNQKYWNWNVVGQRLFGLFLLAALMLVVFTAPFVQYACKHATALMNPLYVVLGAAAGFGGCFVALATKRLSTTSDASKSLERRRWNPAAVFPLIIGVGAIVEFGIQMVVVRKAFFVTGWDAGAITQMDAAQDSAYFSRYPNQLFLAGVFSRLMRMAHYFGVSNGYRFVVIVGCCCVTVSTVLMAFVAKRVGGYVIGYVCFVLSAVFIGLSPWILVPYSDTYGMLLTSLILWCYVCLPWSPVKWIGIGMFAVMGYAIKPTAVFCAIAIVLVEIIALMVRRVHARRGDRTRMSSVSAQQPRRSGAAAMVCIVSAVVGALIGAIGVQSVSLQVRDFDKNAAFSASHFLMMGFNPQNRGVWSAEDVARSHAEPTRQARTAMNLQVWSGRVRDAGIGGTAKLLAKKTCTNFADGTFAWRNEGNFFVDVPEQTNFVQRIYGIRGGEALFAPAAQVIWLAVLLGAVICALRRAPGGKIVNVMCFSLLALGAFLTLFECRARYLFLYAPYFVLLGVLGYRGVVQWTCRKIGVSADHNRFEARLSSGQCSD